LDSGEISIFDDSKVFFLANATGPPKPQQMTSPPEEPHNYNAALFISIQVIVSLAILITLLLGAYTYQRREIKIIKASSTLFLYFILFGGIVAFTGIILLSVYPIVRIVRFHNNTDINFFTDILHLCVIQLVQIFRIRSQLWFLSDKGIFIFVKVFVFN
jgi:hypothetical protein